LSVERRSGGQRSALRLGRKAPLNSERVGRESRGFVEAVE